MNEYKSINLDVILNNSEKERLKLKHPYVGSEHLLLALLKYKNSLTEFLLSYDLTYESFKRELIQVVGQCKKDNPDSLYTPLLRKIIKRYENKYKGNYNDQNIYENLFISLLDEGEGIAIRIMLKMNIDLDDLYVTLKDKQKISLMEESNKVGIFLNNSVDMNESVVGRENELNKIILTLSRKKKCNPILIGPAGVGKTALVEELARRINRGEVPNNLKNNKIFMIEMGSLISGTKYRGEFEERLNKILKELINDKKSIIFIDEIHSMIGAGGAEGAINAADILKPYLARGNIKCIGATTTSEYNESILKDKALARRFEVINVLEPSKDDMHLLLSKIKNEYEKFHNIKIPNQLIDKLIDISDKYIKNIVNPDKCIDLLDSSCAYSKMYGSSNELKLNDIINTIIYKTNNKLINNKDLSKKIINDLKEIISKENSKKLFLTLNESSNLPKSILTDSDEVKRIIVKNLDNINVITIDLEKYSDNYMKNIFDKPINESIFYSLIDNPYSLVFIKHVNNASNLILDEISKINTEGYITYKYNEKIYFNNAILIASTDDEILFHTGFNRNKVSSKLPINFINSFRCTLYTNKEKEISH
jgi:ATP-dependent Clp protease ATP-binding subunit ClpA/ATP-dependent Clp protease ATP-binding subunit ClpC